MFPLKKKSSEERWALVIQVAGTVTILAHPQSPYHTSTLLPLTPENGSRSPF
jgi:hypothetical protein